MYYGACESAAACASSRASRSSVFLFFEPFGRPGPRDAADFLWDGHN